MRIELHATFRLDPDDRLGRRWAAMACRWSQGDAREAHPKTGADMEPRGRGLLRRLADGEEVDDRGVGRAIEWCEASLAYYADPDTVAGYASLMHGHVPGEASADLTLALDNLRRLQTALAGLPGDLHVEAAA